MKALYEAATGTIEIEKALDGLKGFACVDWIESLQEVQEERPTLSPTLIPNPTSY